VKAFVITSTNVIRTTLYCTTEGDYQEEA